MANAPDTSNYYIGKGNVYFTPTGGVERHIGNVPEFEIEVNGEELKHFSSMEGTKSNDLTVITEKGATLRMLMDEWTYQNLSLQLLGEVGNEETSGDISIDILSENIIRGQIRFVGNNDVGPRYNCTLPSVAFKPSSAINLISDEFGQLEVTGDIEITNSSFGTLVLQDSSSTETSTETETGTSTETGTTGA